MFVGRECGNIKAKCGGTALACKPKVHKARSPNPLLQSKNGNSLNCPCFSVHAFFALFTGCHWDWMYSTTFLFLVFFVLSDCVPFPGQTSSLWVQRGTGGTEEAEYRSFTSAEAIQPSRHFLQLSKEFCGSWDACKCLSAMLCTVLD